MCGITGIMNLEDKRLLHNMCSILTHRGPDSEGFYEDKNIGLGIRRLSIIDVNGGDQPIQNEEGDIWTIFNGEIYNYQEIKDSLISKGHKFRTNSDTETIVHAYEEYGLDFVQHLRGMFAIAIWDGKKTDYPSKGQIRSKTPLLLHKQEPTSLCFRIKSSFRI